MSRQAYLRDRARPRSYSLSDPRPLDADRLYQPDQMGSMVQRFVAEQTARHHDNEPDEELLDDDALDVDEHYYSVPLSDYQLAEVLEDMKAFDTPPPSSDDGVIAPEPSTTPPAPADEGSASPAA